MKNLFKKIYFHTLFRGTAVMLFGATLVNFGNYLFHLITGRLISPSQYGVLESLISSLYLLGIIPLSINLIIVKAVSTLKGRGEEGQISLFYFWFRKRMLLLGVLATFVLMLLMPAMGSFLKLNDLRPLFLISLSYPILLLITLLRSYFQGLLDFTSYNISTVAEVVFKIILAVTFVSLGLSVYGIILGMVLSSLIGYVIALPRLKLKKTGKTENFISHNLVYPNTVPMFLYTLSFTSLFSTDIILVKHYFSADQAGLYAAVSVLCKIIFFISGPLVSVMFPIISQKRAQGEKHKHYLFLTLIIAGIFCLFFNTIYYLFPQAILHLLYGEKYLAGSNILFHFSIFLTFYTLANVLANYFLSIGKGVVSWFMIMTAAGQAILIVLYHQSLFEVIYSSIFASLLLLIALLIYYRHED